MSIGWDKQPSSRVNVAQNITWLTTAGPNPGPIVCTSKFSNGTQQIRVISQIAGWVSIDQSTSSTLVTSANIPATGMFVPASTVGGEYFAVTPGQLLTFCSTGTTTGVISVTEMA